MKRNTELAVNLLLFLEQAEDAEGLVRHELKKVLDESLKESPMTEEQRWDALDYHLRLLQTAGFVTMTPSTDGVAHDDFDLTWAGHDYLDANRPLVPFFGSFDWV